jgi:hypothetical protein
MFEKIKFYADLLLYDIVGTVAYAVGYVRGYVEGVIERVKRGIEEEKKKYQ